MLNLANVLGWVIGYQVLCLGPLAEYRQRSQLSVDRCWLLVFNCLQLRLVFSYVNRGNVGRKGFFSVVELEPVVEEDKIALI